MVHKVTPEQPPSNFETAAKELWTLLNSPFKGDLDPVNYQAQLALPVDKDSPAYRDARHNDFVRILTQRDIHPQLPWMVGIAYDNRVQELGVSRLTVPLKAPRPERLIFQATSFDFVPLHEVAGTPHELSAPDNPEQVRDDVSPGYIGKFILSAGYDLRRLGADPSQMRLNMAKLIGRAADAYIEENTTIVSDPALSTQITRVGQKQASSAYAPTSSSVLDRRSGTRSKGASRQQAHGLVTTGIRAVSEFYNPDATTREQLVVEYHGTDYSVKSVEVYRRLLEQISPEIPGLEGSSEYKVTGRKDIPVTTALLEQLTASFIDSMSG